MTSMLPRVHMGWARIAFCTILVLAPLGAAEPVRGADHTANYDRYGADQVARGARTIPVLARLEYQSAQDLLTKGEKEQAEDHLRRALRFDPNYSTAYFALARLEIGRADTDGLVHAIQGVYSLAQTFESQRRMAVNGASLFSYVLLLVNLVVCLAFSIKYLPYVTHKLTEWLQRRYNAALPRVVSYLILLSPVFFFIDTIIPLAYLTVLCWLSMYRRERVVVVVLVAPFIVAGWLDIHVRLAAVVADPKSFTTLVDRANNAASDEHLIQCLEQTRPAGLEAQKDLALGLLHLKGKRYYDASDFLFQSLSLDPQQTMGYINLGNVHFLQGDYEKALQGYRKAESIDPVDPICQYNLAQAYIKTLLMKEASRSLQLAGPGVDNERATYAQDAFEAALVLPKLFSDKELWRIAVAEAKSLDEGRAAEGHVFFPWLPRRAGAVVVVTALVLALLLGRLIDPDKLTFQCSNCGTLTCRDCCNTDKDVSLCRGCASTIESVSSEKVVEALLRQRRQAILIRRRKATRLVSMVLPGVRDIYYGHVSRGVALALSFSASVVGLLTRRPELLDPTAFDTGTPLWQIVAGAAGIVLAYVLSARSRPGSSFKPQHHRAGARHVTETTVEPTKTTHVA
jgi:tetratricopeptide (TPR) repeat protein